ncbi:MAG TPA: HYR domain-containing protein [Candidatus Eisenbacteria bacterium]
MTSLSRVRLLAVATTCTLLFTCGSALAQTTSTTSSASANIDQARNGTAASPTSPVHFQNGNAGAQNSHYIEGFSIPYRVRMDGLTPGTHTVVIGWDVRQGGKNAIDYVSSPNKLEPHAQFVPAHPAEVVDPLEGLTGTFSAATHFAIPAPVAILSGQPLASFNALPAADKELWTYNGTVTGITYVPNADGNMGDLTATSSESRMKITFTATASSVVIAYGGHIASQLDWGTGNSASSISGSPYHSRVIMIDNTSVGNQDRSLSADAVLTCSVEGPATACAGSVQTYGESSTGSGNTYLWSFAANSSGATFVGGNTGSSVQVNVGQASNGSEGFTLQVAVSSGSNAVACSMPVTVSAPAAVSLSGDPVVCPNGVRTYSGPAGMSSYHWTVTGGSIQGAANGQSVTVQAGHACNSTLTVSLDVTNAGGCGGHGDLSVSVRDTQPPVITGVGGPATVECPAQPVFSSPAATDDCSGTAQLTFNDVQAPGRCANEFSVTRTWTATDGCGNAATASQTITVVDHTAPVFAALPQPTTIECPATPSFATASATDACDASPRLSFDDRTTAGSCPGQYSITRTWTATDACGNTSTASQVINVADHTAPVVSCPNDTTVGACQNPVYFSVQANDACGGPVSIVATPASGSNFPVGDNIVTVVARDACGNEGRCTFHVHVLANPGGEISGPSAACPGESVTLVGPAGFDYHWSTGATSQSIVVNASGTYTLTITDRATGCSTTLSHPFTVLKPPVASISGPDFFCSGTSVQLCGPSGAYHYLWTGPSGFTATTRCIDVWGSASYQLVITDTLTGCVSAAASKSVRGDFCNVYCAHTIGWWMAQCSGAANGSVKYPAADLATIYSCVDDQAAIFDWSNDVAGFCAVLNPPSIDQRTQAKRQFAGFLANVCTSQMGIRASNGERIYISLGTPVSFPGFQAGTIGDLIKEADQKLVSLEGQSLANQQVKNQYTQITSAFDAMNNNNVPNTYCPSGSFTSTVGSFDPPVPTSNPGGPVSATAGDAEAGAAIRLYAPSPNPFTGRTHVAYAVGAEGQEVDLAVFDLAGRRVRQLASGVQSVGRHDVDWDGRSESGQVVEGGVYFLRARVGRETRVMPLVHMR